MVLGAFRRASRAAASPLRKLWEILERDPSGCFEIQGERSSFKSRCVGRVV
jgi:hypothetical protein